jgi:hypothetical protein
MSTGLSKFERSWQLIKRSFEVIGSNRKLLLFPIVSFAFTLAIVLFFVAPVFLISLGLAWGDPAHWSALAHNVGVSGLSDGQGGRPGHPVLSQTAFLYLAGIYLVSMVCATFFNVAFYNEILKALRGEAVSLRSGLSFAIGKLGPILLWSLFAGLVGLAIKALEQRFGWVGRLVMRLIGTVWSVASVFAIPVIVRGEEANPVAVLRRSASTLKKTWGQSLIGYVGLTFASTAAILVSLVLLAAGVILSLVLNHPGFIAFLALSWIVAVFALSYVVSIANHIYRCSLYLYASDGTVPAPFTPELMDGAWRVKKA